MGFIAIVKEFLNGKSKSKGPMEQYLTLVKKEPGNAKAHLKLAEMYQKRGDKKKAISEYLMAAEIFLKHQFYARAMAIYKQLPKQDPSLDHVYLKIADIYRKMGFLGDAFAQYRILVQHYDSIGAKEKALEIMALMADMDPRKGELKEKIKEYQQNINVPGQNALGSKGAPAFSPPETGGGEEKKESFFDLGAVLESSEMPQSAESKEISNLEKIYGFGEIFRELKENSGPSAVDPNFNYNLGVASREMGFLDDAIEQFQIALNKGQNPVEAGNLLGLSYKEKGEWENAASAFQRVLAMEGTPQERIMEIKYELGLVYKQQGRANEALGLLQEISTGSDKLRGKDMIPRKMKEAAQGNPMA